MVTSYDRSAVTFSLTPGNVHDASPGRNLISTITLGENECFLLMDRAYEGDETRMKAEDCGFIPVVPPKLNRKAPWEYDKTLYKRRNEIERYFLRLKRFRKVFTRYDKLDALFGGFIYFAMIADAVISVNRL